MNRTDETFPAYQCRSLPEKASLNGICCFDFKYYRQRNRIRGKLFICMFWPDGSSGKRFVTIKYLYKLDVFTRNAPCNLSIFSIFHKSKTKGNKRKAKKETKQKNKQWQRPYILLRPQLVRLFRNFLVGSMDEYVRHSWHVLKHLKQTRLMKSLSPYYRCQWKFYRGRNCYLPLPSCQTSNAHPPWSDI